MIPAFLIDGLTRGFLVLVIARHDIAAAGNNLAGDIGRIAGENLHLHTVDGLATTAGHEFLIVAIGDKGRALGGAIAHGDGEVDAQQELLDLFRERSTANDDLIEIAAESIVDLFADAVFHLLAHYRHRQQQAHAVVLDLGEHLLADDLLQNERHGDDERGTHIDEGLGDDGGRRQTCQEEQMAAMTEAEEKLYRHAVHVGHGQDAQQIIARLDFLAQTTDDKLDITPDGAIGEHDALGVARCTTGVIDKSQLFSLVLMVADVLTTERHGILAAKHHIQMFARVRQLFGTTQHQREIGDVDNAFQSGHLVGVDGLHRKVANEEEL